MNKIRFLHRVSKGASVAQTQNGFRLTIPSSDNFGYRLAQLDDYSELPRRKFPHRSLTLSLRARTSSDSIPGTWGFGVWNDPFVLSFGLGGVPFRMPALPNAAWFFHASPESHLSFTADKPAQGFLAQTFRAPVFHPLLVPAGLAFPFSRKTTRRLLSKMIEEDAIQLWSPTASRPDVRNQAPAGQSVNPTQWHGYRLEWSPKRVSFEVDNAKVLETSVSPRGPLGIVIWVDNQYAAFNPEGKVAYGFLKGQEEWLEVEDISISP